MFQKVTICFACVKSMILYPYVIRSVSVSGSSNNEAITSIPSGSPLCHCSWRSRSYSVAGKSCPNVDHSDCRLTLLVLVTFTGFDVDSEITFIGLPFGWFGFVYLGLLNHCEYPR